MYLSQILSNLANLLIIVSILVTGVGCVLAVLADPLRRWRFFGYLPTVIIALVDPVREKIIVVQYDVKYFGHRFPLMLPQGGIYTNHIGTAVSEALEKELNLTRNSYDIKHIRELGELNIQKHTERMKKYQYGVLGISHLILGKGYIGAICVCDSRSILKSVTKGVGIESVQAIDIEEFKKEQKLRDDSFDGKRIMYNKLIAFVENYLKGKN